MIILNFFPFLFFSFVSSNIFMISLISLSLFNKIVKKNFLVFNLIFFILSFIIFKKIKDHLKLKNISYTDLNWPLIIVGVIIIIYRALTYAHAIDDFVFHMVGGYYFLDLWDGQNLIPIDFSSYLYPIMPLSYYPFLEFTGIRLTLIIFYFAIFIWFISLNARLNYFFFKNERKKHLYLNLFFTYLFFFPQLILTHVTFMSDFYVVVFVLEGLFILLQRKNEEYGLILILIGALIKQSLGLFVLPLFTYFLLINFQKVLKKRIFLLIFFLILIFPIRSYYEIKNPFGSLYNNIFKSPLFEEKHHRLNDLRWGAFTFSERIYWPFIAMFTNKYNEEISVSKIAKVLYPPFLFIPYLFSFYLFIKRKKFIYLICFFSILFWSWNSGYGRYQIAMMSMIWLIILYYSKNYLSNIKINEIFQQIILFVFVLMLFPLIRNDYGMRNFVFIRFFPPMVSDYDLKRFLTGFKYIGNDRYIDIFNQIKNNFTGVVGIVVINRGVSTYYAFLGAKFNNLPVYSFIDLRRIEKIKNSNLSYTIKKNVNNLIKSKKLLLVTTKDFPNAVEKTWIFEQFKCIKLNRDKLVSQFMHDNYFNYVEEYSCKR